VIPEIGATITFTISGIAILDTTAIPEMCYAISMFFSEIASLILYVCMLVCLYDDKAINCCVNCMKCMPASVNINKKPSCR